MFRSLNPAPTNRAELPWWAWRRRAARARFLELVARTEIRVSCDNAPHLACSFEQAYLTTRYAGNAQQVAGLSFVDLATMGNTDTGQTLTVSLRMPLDVKL